MNKKFNETQIEEAPDRRPLFFGLGFGILFGFLLHKGGATKYDVIVGQLLLTDFTVLKIMLSAVATGMIGVYFMKSLGWIKLSLKRRLGGQKRNWRSDFWCWLCSTWLLPRHHCRRCW
jgi:hypothetical protein